MRYLAALIAFVLLGVPAGEELTFFHENVMGTSLELRVRADTVAAARAAEDRLLREIDRLASILSNHDPSSEFRRWQAAPLGPIKVSPELFEVLQFAEAWRTLTGGAFDPRAEILTRLWSKRAGESRAPSLGERAEVIAQLATDPYRLDPASHTAERLADAPLTLDAIAKGYVVERACAAAYNPAQGIHGLLLNVGGDIRAVGEVPWTIGLAPPRGDSESVEPTTQIQVRDRSVATSGDSQRGFVVEGRHFSHILDPRTGQPAAQVIAATVVAPIGADADALATALNLLPPQEGLRLVATLPDVACLVVAADGREITSPNWGDLEVPLASLPQGVACVTRSGPVLADDPPASPSWADSFEVAIDFEIARPETEPGRYRRPYVVIWAEDENGELVRQIVAWVSQSGGGPDQWLPDLTRWYGSQDVTGRTRRRNYLYTIGRPTRPAGTYSVVWDGKDDQGRPLPIGTYTLFLETAREHGTHQLMRRRLLLDEKPFTEQLQGNVEIKSATVEYRRKISAE